MTSSSTLACRFCSFLLISTFAASIWFDLFSYRVFQPSRILESEILAKYRDASSVDLSGKVIVTKNSHARLGNKLSTFATLYAYKLEFGLLPAVPHEVAWIVCFYFVCREEVLILETAFPNWKRYTWVEFDPDNPMHLDPTNSNAPNPHLGHYVTVGPYLWHMKYIRKNLPKLRDSFFTMKERFTQYARDRIAEATISYKEKHAMSKEESIQYVGIHSRRSDYEYNILLWNNLTLVRADYFTRAMNIFRTSEKNPLFIVVSDDMDWARANIISVDGDCFFYGTGVQSNETNPPNEGITMTLASIEIGNDFALLTQMNHIIMTYGTFATWGALLAGAEKVILPRGYESVNGEAVALGWTFV